MQQGRTPTETDDSAPGGVNAGALSDTILLARFSADHDEVAFSELVRRHGPLVLGVCRRILGDAHAAEDVFQAVFLVLAKKSGSIHSPELLANWLYGVACRIARKSRMKSMKEATRERWAVNVSTQTKEALGDVEWTELMQVLDEEVSQLPEKFRAPLVLCYLQGQTNAQAAAQLGWPSGSISDRLAQAREMLRHRLCRRGMNLTAALLAVLLTQKVASAAVSPGLAAATVKTAVSLTARKATTAAISQNVLDLARDSTGLSPASVAKVLALAVVIMVSAVSIARSQGIHGWQSVFPGWSGSAGGQESGASCSMIAVAPELPDLPAPDKSPDKGDESSDQ